MDTGVDTGFLTPPAGSNLGTLVECPDSTLVECLPPGDVIGIYLPNETNPVAFYSFTTDLNGNPMQPDGVHNVSGSSVFFNTSRHVLGGINFLYDNTNGYIGYIWNGHSSSSIGYVHPATTSSATSLISSQNPSTPGSAVTFTATVTGIDSSQIPTGGITFVIDGNQQYITLNGAGQATYSTSQLTEGEHTIVAKYSGDSTYIRSTSSILIQTVELPGMQLLISNPFLQEFKTFAMRGNVVDLGVGFIIGASFGKIVSSLVADVIMPPRRPRNVAIVLLI